jgi:hypothetical protein
MNRVTSVLAGAVTAAISGAVIAAAAVGQGVFDGTPTKSTASQDTTRVASSWVANDAATVAVAAAPIATAAAAPLQIVYVDKEPLYVTRTVVQQVEQNTDAQQPTATPTQQPTPTATATPTAATPTPKPVATVQGPPVPVPTQAPVISLAQPRATPVPTIVSRSGDDHDGRHPTTTTGTTGRTSGRDD